MIAVITCAAAMLLSSPGAGLLLALSIIQGPLVVYQRIDLIRSRCMYAFTVNFFSPFIQYVFHLLRHVSFTFNIKREVSTLQCYGERVLRWLKRIRCWKQGLQPCARLRRGSFDLFTTMLHYRNSSLATFTFVTQSFQTRITAQPAQKYHIVWPVSRVQENQGGAEGEWKHHVGRHEQYSDSYLIFGALCPASATGRSDWTSRNSIRLCEVWYRVGLLRWR